MKNIRCIVLFALFLSANSVGAQDTILYLREIPRTKRIPEDIARVGLPIVDINSQLEIRPNASAIQAAAQQRFPQFFKDKLLKDKSERIENLLSNQLRITELMKQMVAGLAVGRELRKQLRPYIDKIKADPQLREDYNRYTDEYYLLYTDPATAPDQFVYSIERFNEQLDEIARDIQKMQPGSQVQFSVAAFRRDAQGGGRVHVENFDEFENGEFFSVPRWITTLSHNDKEQLDHYRQLAQGLNENANQVLESYKGKLLESFPSISCAQQIRPELESAIQEAGTDLKPVLEQIKTGQINEILPIFTQLGSDLQNWKSSESPTWRSHLNELFLKLGAVSQQLNLAIGDTLLQANPHLQNLGNCLKQSIHDLKSIQELVQQFPYSYLNKVSLKSEDLAAEILAFDLNAIPPVGTIDLEYTGARKSGDELLIKAVLRLPNDSTADRATGHTIEARRLQMQLVGPHTVTKIGVIMANPYTMDVPPDKPKFRFAPSAALLVKFGSRKSHFYNNFLDMGIGLNTAAPDFDLNGAPEFSAGFIGTVFRDILSVGWNWNFGLNRPNYFIGIHLPFNLPGLPVNTIQNNPMPE